MASDVITPIDKTDPEFYPLMGPFLASRDVVHQVGGPIWDDDGKTWLVARRDGAVTGFIALTKRGARTVVESGYTVAGSPALMGRLVKAAVRHAGSTPLTATVRHEHTGAYTAAGFTVVEEKVNFVRLERTS